MIKTSFSDPDIETRNMYSYHNDVYYKGEPFTGTIVGPLEELEYVDGKAHGKWLSRYENGNTECLRIFEHGIQVETREYFQNGALKKEWSDGVSRRWNYNESLISKENEKSKKEFFSNGALKIEYPENEDDDWAAKYYTRAGDLAYTQLKDIKDGHQIKRNIEYNDDVLLEHYQDLLAFDNIEHKDDQYYRSTETSRTGYVWKWLWIQFNKDSSVFFRLINKLLEHPDKGVKDALAQAIAYHKFHSYIDAENEGNFDTYELIRKYTEHYDRGTPDREIKTVKQ